MKRLVVVCGLLFVMGGCIYLMFQVERGANGKIGGESLEVYCAAGMQRPVEEVAALYEAEYGVQMRLNFGGSGQLYAKLAVAGGDLYLPADRSYIDQADREGLVKEALPVSSLTAGLIVAEGNPERIDSLQDLMREDVSVVLADESAAVGKFTNEVLAAIGVLAEIERGRMSKVGTVNEVAMQVELGASDVGVVWDALVPQFRQCEFIDVVEFKLLPKQAMIGLLKSSQNESEALEFARYLTARNKGAVIFKKHGFEVIEGDDYSRGSR